jgi:AcrR family transcriptional regulator
MDEGGLENLSMRKLAAELDVNPMSLYHHVASKEALLELICATAALRMALPPDDDAPWQDQLRALTLAYHRHAREHPALWTHVHNHPKLIADRRLQLWKTLDRILRLAGVPEAELCRTGDVLHAFVSGLIVMEIRGHIPDDPAEIDRTLDMAINIILHGLARSAHDRGDG